MTTQTFTRLRRWRQDNDLTIADLADLSGLSQAMVSRVERGQRDMAPLTKVRFARRLGVRVADLFEVEVDAAEGSCPMTEALAIEDCVPDPLLAHHLHRCEEIP